MSWQSYIDGETGLLKSGKIAKAAILGHQGDQQGVVWASSSDYALLDAERKAIVAGFTNADTVRENGVRLAGKKFFTISVEKDPKQSIKETIQAKKGADGAIIVKTKQAIIVAEYTAPHQAAEVNPLVQSVADYLLNSGY